jgi:hypothetical protein
VVWYEVVGIMLQICRTERTTPQPGRGRIIDYGPVQFLW